MKMLLFAACTVAAMWWGWHQRGKRDAGELDQLGNVLAEVNDEMQVLSNMLSQAIEDRAEALRDAARWHARAVRHPTGRSVRSPFDQDAS